MIAEEYSKFFWPVFFLFFGIGCYLTERLSAWAMKDLEPMVRV